MSTHRLEQINENIRTELSAMFSRELEIPADCLVSISRVVTAEDLKTAQVWLSILPIDRRSKVRNIIKNKKVLLQGILNKRLKMKPIPRLNFLIDFTEEKAWDIESVIDKAMKEL